MFFALSYVRYNEEQRLYGRLNQLVSIVEVSWENHLPVLEQAVMHVVEGEPPAHVVVILPDGVRYEGGVASPDQTVLLTGQTIDGAEISVAVSSWSIWVRSAQLVAIFAVVAAVALLAGALVALEAAKRFARPVVNLANAASQLGQGRVNAQIPVSGVAEVDLVAAELAVAADRVAVRLAAEREFLSSAKHQLRTPLTALSMRLEEIQLISDDAAVDEEARIGLEQVERLVQVIDDLFAASRNKQSSTTQLVALAPIVNQQLEEWQRSYAAKGRRLVSQVPPGQQVVATSGRLSQVLATLIENSLQHGGGTTTIRTRPVSRNRVAIEVIDQGRGISNKHTTSIFERGFTTSETGTGLGLALARDLVAADNGMLELEQASPPIFAVYLSSVFLPDNSIT